jgi:hypothetical protein
MLRICSPLLALFASVWLIGCSSAAPAPAPVTASAPPAAPTSGPPAANVSSNALPVQGEFPGITVTIQELKRSSSALTLKFVMANQSKNDFGFGAAFREVTGDSDWGSVGAVHLIDGNNKKKYFVIRDSDGACLCSRNVPNIAAGSQAVLWAKFPLPPDDVQKITVEVPHCPPFEDVPVTH